MTQPMLIRSHQVARMLGLRSAMAFLTRRDRLEADLYFPLPMPHTVRPLLWKADEISAWLNRHGGPAQPHIAPELLASGQVALLQMARTA